VKLFRRQRNNRPLSGWKPALQPLSAAVKQARETFVFLHLPKTGGSSFVYAMNNAPGWVGLKLPPLHSEAGKICNCGDPKCDSPNRSMDKIAKLAPTLDSTKGLFIMNGHSKFSELDWLTDQLSSRATQARMIAVVRPARERVVSMFRDYWEQVNKAEIDTEETSQRAVHMKNVRNRYLADAAHYRDETGRIDGPRWFSTFARYRGGITFQLNQIFDQKPDVLAKALASGQLQAIPTFELDTALEKMTGIKPERRRVSSQPSDFLTTAIEDSADLIDTIAAFDEPFDAVLADHLGIERFDPKRAR
jgi:hypothetical protein